MRDDSESDWVRRRLEADWKRMDRNLATLQQIAGRLRAERPRIRADIEETRRRTERLGGGARPA